MKKPVLSPVLLLAAFFLLLCLLVLLTRTACPLCGRPVYFYLLRCCGH